MVKITTRIKKPMFPYKETSAFFIEPAIKIFLDILLLHIFI